MSSAFISELKSALKSPLPGKKAHLDMAPGMRSEQYMHPAGDYKTASVQLLLFNTESRPHLIFIKRATITGDKHSGQISFPGGQIEDSDMLSLEACALRETHEELGLDPSKINLLGALTPIYVYVSNFMVYPFLGIYEGRPEYILQESEVDHVIEVPLERFLSNTLTKKKDIIIRNTTLENVPYYDLDGETLWGATAMITSEFITIVKSIV